MLNLTKGRYSAQSIADSAEMASVMALRALCFRGDAAAQDADAFDPMCRHMGVYDGQGGQLVCTFRLLSLPSGQAVSQCYASQFYDLTRLEAYGEPLVELGRFCVRPGHNDPDILRVAWGAMTRFVDAGRVGMMFGCSSFPGIDAGPFSDTFALLRERHLAPAHLAPGPKAPGRVTFARALTGRNPDMRRAQAAMPSLLRTYLMMGGWVSDHAVVDPELGTLHVFTGLEISAVPAARARLLRNVAE